MPLGICWNGLVLPLVLAWYIITELGSILENAVKMGAKVPVWLVNLLKAGIRLAESAGDSTVENLK
jgi:phage-related holin